MKAYICYKKASLLVFLQIPVYKTGPVMPANTLEGQRGPWCTDALETQLTYWPLRGVAVILNLGLHYSSIPLLPRIQQTLNVGLILVVLLFVNGIGYYCPRNSGFIVV